MVGLDSALEITNALGNLLRNARARARVTGWGASLFQTLADKTARDITNRRMPGVTKGPPSEPGLFRG
jgi:hypothetical protein